MRAVVHRGGAFFAFSGACVMHAIPTETIQTLRKPFYRQLYFQVVFAIIIGVLLGYF
ncbi:hypothetical protein CT3_39230 [Comamonas terrigena NBRC 13299]|nr:hypothetical protein CT3_39230 [Comamonas terrigena NBRC 13299]